MAKGKKIEFSTSQFEDPIYCCTYEVYFGNVDEISKYYSQQFRLNMEFPPSKEDGINASAFFIYDPNRDVYVMVFERRPKPDIIAHECFHAAMRVLNHIGYSINTNSETGDDEPAAYLLSFLVRMVYHSMREAKKKKA